MLRSQPRRAGRSTAATSASSPRCRRERAAERRAQAFERHQSEQLALPEIEPPQAVAVGESVRAAGAIEVPREAGIGQHGEITAQTARARRLVVADLVLELLEANRPSSIALNSRTSKTTFGSDRSSGTSTLLRQDFAYSLVSAHDSAQGARRRAKKFFRNDPAPVRSTMDDHRQDASVDRNEFFRRTGALGIAGAAALGFPLLESRQPAPHRCSRRAT